MPVFEIESGGKVFELEAPDQGAALSAMQARGGIDKLLGLTGERYQTWPERAIREIAGMPKKAMEAAQSAPAGSREATEAMVAPAADVAMVAIPQSRAPGIFGMRPKSRAAPALEELEVAVNRGYKSARDSGITIPPERLAAMKSKIEADLIDSGHLPGAAPKTYEALRAMEPPVPRHGEQLGPIGVNNVEQMRRAFSNARMDKPESDAARRAIGIIDDELSTLSPELKAARDNAAAKFRAEDIDARLGRAERQAAKSGSGANVDNALRQKVGAKLDQMKVTSLDMQRGKMGYTAGELQQMNRVTEGSRGGNLARLLGKLAPQHPVTGWPASVGGAVTGTAVGGPIGGAVGAVVPPAIGMVAKALAEKSTQKQAKILDEMIRSRSPLYNEKLAASPREVPKGVVAIVRALIAEEENRRRVAPDSLARRNLKHAL